MCFCEVIPGLSLKMCELACPIHGLAMPRLQAFGFCYEFFHSPASKAGLELLYIKHGVSMSI